MDMHHGVNLIKLFCINLLMLFWKLIFSKLRTIMVTLIQWSSLPKVWLKLHKIFLWDRPQVYSFWSKTVWPTDIWSTLCTMFGEHGNNPHPLPIACFVEKCLFILFFDEMSVGQMAFDKKTWCYIVWSKIIWQTQCLVRDRLVTYII